MNERGTKATLLAFARAAARSLSKQASTSQARVDVCLDLLSDIGGASQAVFRRALHALPADERQHWIGTLYTVA